MARRRRRTVATSNAQRKQPGRAIEPRHQEQTLPSAPRDWTHSFVAVGVVVVVGTLYVLTAARDIVLGDTPELMTAAVTLGVPHAPGYPLFTMLGHLFSLLPTGPLPFRVDLLAVVCGVTTVELVYLTALRLTRDRMASVCAAFVLAVTPLFWSWSLVAEVFSPANLLAATFIFLLVLWHERPERMGFLVGAAFVSGLALTNQQTIVLLGPATLFLLWRRRAQLIARPSILAACVGAILVGLLPYAYLPWAAARHPLYNWGDASTLENFLAVITRKHFGTGQLINAPQYQGGSPFARLGALGLSFGPLGALSILGAVQACRQIRWYFWFGLLAFTFTGPVFVAYANINLSVPLTRLVLERFYLLSHVAIAPFAAFGVLLTAQGLASVAPRIRVRAVQLAGLAVLVAVFGSAIANFREVDQSKDHVTRRFAEDILATLEPDSILVANGDEVIMPLTYLQDAEGMRPDVTLITMPFLLTDWYLPQLRRRDPRLVVPFERYDRQSGTIKNLIDANRERTFAFIGIASDESLKGTYWFYRRGLVVVAEPMAKDIKLDEMIADNELLFGRYRPPSPTDIKQNSLEQSILTHYATPAVVVAGQCEQLGYVPQARAWYQRALALDPTQSQVRDALRRLPDQ